MTDRESLYATLPAVADPWQLADHDVVLDATGLFRTVSQAWHGPDGVEPHCLPGALPLSLFGDAGYGTDLPDVVLVPPIVLLGRLGDGFHLTLRRDGTTVDAFGGNGRFRTAELIEPADVHAGDVLVLEDGRAHRVAAGRMLRALRTEDWSDTPGTAPVPLDRYLDERDLDTLPLTVLR
ncbi:hypothetical protein [Actinoplanes sp. NPDC051494]|uniref:hypothetical protein n=1 Tax=Actinoplanes sp. NPDC051494 TaxID=3363907 RepID=UPI0037AE5291